MALQHPLTLVTPVSKEYYGTIYELLRQLKLDLEADRHEKFKSFDTIHYARWFVMDDVAKGMYGNPENQGMKLVCSVNYDGPEEKLLQGLCNEAGYYIDRLYACCEGYMPEDQRTPENRIAYLKQWREKAAAFYKGSPGASLIQIRNESKLRNYIRDLLDAHNWKGKTAKQVHQIIKDDVLSKPEFSWVKEKVKVPSVNWPGMVLLALIILPLLPVVLIWVIIIEYFYERHDAHFTLTRSQLSENHIKTLEEYEDHEHQNQFTQLVVMKPGKVRLITFKALMLFARGLIGFYFRKGKLMGIPTIHFARWVLFDNNKRVLFFSNFDGSWQQYLGDFIDQSGWGLTGIFSNTTNFPKAKFLFAGGAYDEEHFLAWSRYTELQTQVWYCAYPDLSIKNVNNNTIIRANLIKNLSEKQATEFLKLI